MPAITAILQSVLATLLEEERGLAALIVLAVQEQEALIASDYTEITRVSDAMLSAANSLDALEERRGDLLAGISAPDASFDALIDLASENGVAGFDDARAALASRAAELRDAQERNALLLISAMKLHERWVAMFGSLTTSTYGAAGQQEHHRGRQFVSRTA